MQPFVKHVRVENPSATIRFRATAVSRNHPRLSEILNSLFNVGFKAVGSLWCCSCQATHPRLLEIWRLPFTDYWKINRLTGGIPFFKKTYHTTDFSNGIHGAETVSLCDVYVDTYSLKRYENLVPAQADMWTLLTERTPAFHFPVTNWSVRWCGQCQLDPL